MQRLYKWNTLLNDFDQTHLQRQITATDRQIDQLVYELYDLTPEEIRIKNLPFPKVLSYIWRSLGFMMMLESRGSLEISHRGLKI